MTEQERKYHEAVQKVIDLYGEYISKGDYFSCVKQLGVLEYLNAPDIEYFTGMAYHVNRDYSNAVEYFAKVGKSSPMYDSSRYCMAMDYMCIGDYLSLDKLFKSENNMISSLQEINIRIRCLEQADSEYLKNIEDELKEIIAPEVKQIDDANGEGELFFEICGEMAKALVVTGECMNQCIIYQKRMGKPLEQFIENEDMRPIILQYSKWCHILEYSKYIRIIRLPENIKSLSICALSDKKWGEKLRVFSKTNYAMQIIQIIYTLCCPEVHQSVDAYSALEVMMDAYSHVRPEVLAQVIDHYFDIVAKAYQENKSAVQYVNYVYSEILATENDPYNLRNRIDKIINDSEYDYQKIADDMRLTQSLSRKGYDAWRNAERVFQKFKDDVNGAKDYSALSLQFFRVLEIEYCEKLILPLAKTINNSELKSLVDECNDKCMINKWKADYSYLCKISEGGQSSIEIGAVRTLLAHVVGFKSQNEECAKYLRKHIDCFLTDEGKDALQQKRMLEVINKESLEKYRIPGAHTGFLPFSVAKEARDYVTEKLKEIATWFK